MPSIKIFQKEVVSDARNDINDNPLWNVVDSDGDLVYEVTFGPDGAATFENRSRNGDTGISTLQWTWSLSKSKRAPGRVTLRLESLSQFHLDFDLRKERHVNHNDDADTENDWIELDLQEPGSTIGYRNVDSNRPDLRHLHLLRNEIDDNKRKKAKPANRNVQENTADRCMVS